MTASDKPVIIIGAGVVGLTLAHGLKKANIPFQVFERDEHVESRNQGWAITLHWALRFLRDILDDETLAAVDQVQVDPEVGRNDNGNFLFLNLETLETKFRIPPNERRRVNREKLRRVLIKDIADHVHWGKRLVDVETLENEADGVRALFADGEQVEGRILVGADGTNSSARKFLVPDAYQNYQLPVEMLGAAVKMTRAEAKPIRDIDPLLFQGCHPTTGVFLWISMLDTPETNGTAGTDDEHYMVQVIVSWIVKGDRDQIPATDPERVAMMKRLAVGFNPLLRNAVDVIPESYPVLNIALQDWPCLPWDNHDGRVTLIGDAAHAMTMYRGEAGNHGILDAWHLLREIKAVYSGEKTRKEAMDKYEEEMMERGIPAVMLSRQACLDAHDFHGLNENSAVLKRRAIKT
ncbi:FAD-dependent monooxygenase dbaB [Cladobotryum mycophilum]|uniref:FAD-dependent monooxygenase dbaB n=1 Tax=Cladobotryum mycophilum TaxID=491253 RepID=A0ABR0STW0_9HYPO